MNLKKIFTLCALLLCIGSSYRVAGQGSIQFANPETTCNGSTPSNFCIDVVLTASTAFNTGGWATLINFDNAVLGSPQVTVNPAFNDVANYQTASSTTSNQVNISCFQNGTATFVNISATPTVAATVCFSTLQTGNPGLSFDTGAGNIVLYDDTFSEVSLNPAPAAFSGSVACQTDPCAGVTITVDADYSCVAGVATLTLVEQAGITYAYTNSQPAANGNALTDGQTVNVVGTNADGCVGTSGSFTVDCPALDPCADVVIPVSTTYTCVDGVASLVIENQDLAFDYTYGDGSVASSGDILTDGQVVTVSATSADGCVGTAAAFTVDCQPIEPPTVVPLVINEIDYNTTGTDAGEFIELYNPTNEAALLDGFYLSLINGSNGTEYLNIPLTGSIAAGGYFVICAAGSGTANCNLEIDPGTAGFIQNATDGIGLYLTDGGGIGTDLLLDAVSYGTGTIEGLTEGSAGAGNDDGEGDFGLSRLPNGNDTDDNGADFALVGITPGAANDACAGATFSVQASSTCDATTGVANLILIEEAGIGYTYSNGSAAANGDELANGSYTISGTDANGCVRASQPFTVSCDAPSPCDGVVIEVAAGFACNEGVATLTLTEEAGITYTYSNGSTAANGDLLTNGTTYTITGTNADGCTGSATVSVQGCTPPDPCDGVVIEVATSFTCNEGVATLEIANESLELSYTYGDGSAATTGDLLAHNQDVTIVATNADGCTGSASFVVNCPPIGDPCEGVVIDVASNTGYNCIDGVASLVLTPQAGITYTYGDGSTATAGDLLSHLQDVAIVGTNADGCFGADDFVVDCPPLSDPCDGVVIFVNASYSCTTGLSVSASGGTGSYSFTINGSTVNNGTTLANGNYTVVAVDANGCSGQSLGLIVNCQQGCDNPPVVQLVSPQALCNSSTEGNANLNLNSILGTSTPGGTWSASCGSCLSGDNFSAQGLAVGAYVVTYSIAAAGDCPAVSGSRTIFVNDCNPAPVAVPDFTAAAPGQTVTVNVVSNDTDAGGGTLALTGATVNPALGTVTTAGNNVTFVPAAGTTGSVTITYTIVDNAGQTAQGTLTINYGSCLANAGSIILNSNFNQEEDKYIYCSGAFIQIIQTSPFNDDNDYTQTYVVTNENGTIVSLAQIPFITPPGPGLYFACAINYEEGNISGLQLGADIDNLSGCFSKTCADKLLVLTDINITYTVAQNTAANEQVYTFCVSGGYPELANGGCYSINWPPYSICTTPVIVGEDTTYVACGDVTIPCETDVTEFNFAVYSDGSNCDAFITVPVNPCPPILCNPTPGSMPGPQFICAGNVASVLANGLEIHPEDDEVAVYVLYNPANFDINDPTTYIATATPTGANNFVTFAFVEGEMSYNTTYEVIAIVGPDDNGDGLPDMNNAECTAVADGATELTFLPPLVLDATHVCNDQEQTYTVQLSYNGGYDIDVYEDAVFTIEGTSTSITAYAADSLIVGPFAGGSVYQFMVTDLAGCTASVEQTDAVDCKVLPISLLNFSGEVLPTANLLKWTTANELNNNYFTLLRSTDGVNFTPIATVDGAGNSNFERNYSYEDKSAPAGVAYYRLDQTDFDGTTTTPAELISLTRGEVKFGVTQLVPVPAHTTVAVSFSNNTKSSVQLTVHNIEGKVVSTQIVEAIAGLNNVVLDVTNYVAGTYFLTLNNGLEVQTIKFVKQQ